MEMLNIMHDDVNTGEFPDQRPVTRSLDVFFHLRLKIQKKKNRGDLRRHRDHYDVNVMSVENDSVRIYFRLQHSSLILTQTPIRLFNLWW